MASLNKVMVIGNLGGDPEMQYTPNGTAVTKFSVAANESWTDRAGTKQERTEWFRVVAFDKLAELCAQYLAKGRQAYVEGRLQTRSWDGADGQKHYMTEVVANTVRFLGGNGPQPTEEAEPATGRYGGPEEADLPF